MLYLCNWNKLMPLCPTLGSCSNSLPEYIGLRYNYYYQKFPVKSNRLQETHVLNFTFVRRKVSQGKRLIFSLNNETYILGEIKNIKKNVQPVFTSQTF